MRLGWKVFIPVTLVWIVFVGAMLQTYLGWFRSADGRYDHEPHSRTIFKSLLLLELFKGLG